jgi:hypothetical protein
VQKVAKDLGTLIAAMGTVQGESGWYAGPDGSLYYFIHDKVTILFPASSILFYSLTFSKLWLHVRREFGHRLLAR